VERYIHFNKKKPETPNTNQTKTTHISNPATTKSAWCCSSECHPTPSLLLRRHNCLQTHPSEERSKNTNSANSSNGDAANRQSQQSQLAHSLHGGIDRGSPQSTLNCSTSGAFHTLQQMEPRNTNHQRNQDYSHRKFSVNGVSVVLSFRALANAFVPAAPIPLTADKPEWRDPNTNSATQFQWATLPTGYRNNRN
jgi:hypothetical protein